MRPGPLCVMRCRVCGGSQLARPEARLRLSDRGWAFRCALCGPTEGRRVGALAVAAPDRPLRVAGPGRRAAH